MQTILITSKNAFNCLARLASGQTGIQLLKQRWSGLRALPNDLRAPRSYQFPRLPPPPDQRETVMVRNTLAVNRHAKMGATEASYVTAAGDFKGTHRHVGAMSTRRTGCKFITSSLISSPLLWVRSNSVPPHRQQLFSLLDKEERRFGITLS